ncbi:hypothetical protein BASA60_003214 [Batrachochytrium salamandrivorans]|nr:hypothetical protein BASA60_003214 [Batrachochytrium salamandrivorans]
MPIVVVDTLQASHRSTAIEAHVAALAASYGMHLSVMQRMWEEKRRELESNLGMLWHGMPSDSYDDQLIPTWHLAEHKLTASSNTFKYRGLEDNTVKDNICALWEKSCGSRKFTGNSSGEDSRGRSFNTSSASQSAPKAARSADAKIAYCCER